MSNFETINGTVYTTGRTYAVEGYIAIGPVADPNGGISVVHVYTTEGADLTHLADFYGWFDALAAIRWYQARDNDRSAVKVPSSPVGE